MNIFIDTSIFVDCLRKDALPSSTAFMQCLGDNDCGYVSSITIAELSVGAHLSNRKDALEKTLRILKTVEIIDIDETVAIKAGKIYSKLAKEGKQIELNDCLIAATSLSVGINKIVTRNINHFQRIEEIEVLIPENLGF